jgi:hypothetical protein
MKVRLKDKPEETGYSDSFNMHALYEVVVNYDNGGADSVYISDLEVFLSDGNWHDLEEAFLNHFLIMDNLNSIFFEPKYEEDQLRGYTIP